MNTEDEPTCEQEDPVCGIHTGCKSGRRGARKHQIVMSLHPQEEEWDLT
jgi:hypothetical protein